MIGSVIRFPDTASSPDLRLGPWPWAIYNETKHDERNFQNAMERKGLTSFNGIPDSNDLSGTGQRDQKEKTRGN